MKQEVGQLAAGRFAHEFVRFTMLQLFLRACSCHMGEFGMMKNCLTVIFNQTVCLISKLPLVYLAVFILKIRQQWL